MADNYRNQTSGRSLRTYDVIIFGASGFTGKYVIREALKFLNAANSPLKSLALAGRSPARLSEALKWASGPNPPPEIPLLTADSSDPSSLRRLAAQAKIILNCVGPFQLYGPPVVSACVNSGCDYLDISGEPEFMDRMEGLYHDKAVEKGSLVISACGFDSIPAEMGLLFHSRHWAGPSAPNRVEAYLSSDQKLVWNYGSYKTSILEIVNGDKVEELRRSGPKGARPAIHGPPPPTGAIIEHQKKLGLWSLPFPSADDVVVPRTLSTLADHPHGLPGAKESVDNLQKRESFWSSVKPAHFGVRLCSKSLLGLFPVILFGIFLRVLSRSAMGRWLLLKFPSFFSIGWFRKDGPSEDEVVNASFKMWFVGEGFSETSVGSQYKKPDTQVITRVTGPEAAYRTTPIALLQCALILLNDRDNLPRGGVFTPGIVFGPTELQERLQENGISFDFVSMNSLPA